MNIFKISVLIRKPTVVWDYKKNNGSDFWDDLNGAIKKAFTPELFASENKSSFQHIIYIPAERDSEGLKNEVGDIVSSLFSGADGANDVIIVVNSVESEELSALRKKDLQGIEGSGFWAAVDAAICEDQKSSKKQHAEKVKRSIQPFCRKRQAAKKEISSL